MGLIHFTIFLLVLSKGPDPNNHRASAITTLAQKKKITKIPRYNENKSLCNGTQLKEEVTNPVCKGWRLDQISPDESFYAEEYSDACAKGANNGSNITCWFRSAKEACVAFTYVQEQRHPVKNETPYTPAEVKISDDKYACTYCWAGESKNAGGYCPNGNFDIFLRSIPPEEYHEYCGAQVSGPYSNLPEDYTICGATYTQTYNGMPFVKSQRGKILAANRASNRNGKIRSDLAGFCYDPPNGNPGNCIKAHPVKIGKCVEPEFLEGRTYLYERNAPQVHHVVPAKDRRGCPCGKNSVKNAAVISAQLNRYFTNKNREAFLYGCDSGMTEIEKVNSLPKYNP
jgi:hypothetical protein